MDEKMWSSKKDWWKSELQKDGWKKCDIKKMTDKKKVMFKKWWIKSELKKDWRKNGKFK